MPTRRRLATPISNLMVASHSFIDVHFLRREAAACFERCLEEGVPHPLEAFIEQQVAQETPPVLLLDDIAADLRQRLLALHQAYDDMRADALRDLRETYGVELGALLPSEPHTALLPAVVEALPDAHQRHPGLRADPAFHGALESALIELRAAARRVHLAEHLVAYTADWLAGLHVMVVQGAHENHKPTTH